MESIDQHDRYAPIVDTARLYAGWLLAWYAVLFLLSGQHALGRFPWDVSWLDGIARSPLVLRCAFGTFLFLLLSSLHRSMRGGGRSQAVLTVLWIGAVVVFAVLV